MRTIIPLNMARVFGIQGNVTGKIANTIYAVVKGVNVARAYNPEPANPQTPSQVESRAKLKELSQLGAALAPLMGFQPKGLVSARNQFISTNYDKVSFQSDVAEVQLEQLDMTGSRVGLGRLSVQRSASGVTATISDAAEGLVAVVYGMTIVNSDGTIIVRPPRIINAPGTEGNWPSGSIFVDTPDRGVLYVFGIRANDASEVAKYGYIQIQADNIATLMATVQKQYAGSTTTTQTVTAEVDPYQGD